MIVTVLTGRRPDLLSRTLRTIPKATVFVNEIDHNRESVDVAKHYNATVLGWNGWTPVGESMSRIAEWVVEQDDPYWLHVEDDWRALGPLPLTEATELLDARPDVGQVRLRKKTDGAKLTNYITGEKIEWTGGPIAVGNAHATWNPTVARTSDATLYPVDGEVDFMKKHSLRYPYNAQHEGVFVHLGRRRSLR